MDTIAETHQSLIHHQKGLSAISARKLLLKKLKEVIIKNEEKIFMALKKDLGRADFESYVAEVALIKDEIDLALKSLGSWAKKQSVKTPLVFQPGHSYIMPTPKGVVLVISPWNYPFQLSLVPIVSAIAAGNACLLKPSELSVHSSALLADMINELATPFIKIICGNKNTAEALLDLPFDHIFYTGSTVVGSLVMKKAALHLTPVTLELGGKSPCIILKSASLELSAKRIMWAKCLNAGQTCIAPDYVLIERELRDKFVAYAKKHLALMYKNPKSPDFSKIINLHHFDRLVNYLKDGTIIHGGHYDRDRRYIEPTLLIDVDPKAPVMREEIFGPILPIIAVDDLKEAIDFINQRPHPLALYIFAKDNRAIEHVLSQTLSGGVCINDCLSHVGISGLPFGGVRHSGMGAYHGQHGFNTFSHFRAIHQRANILDNPIKYPPYSKNKLKLARMVM